jgi:hypothetical protein
VHAAVLAIEIIVDVKGAKTPACPGKKQPQSEIESWDRDLDTDLAAIKA